MMPPNAALLIWILLLNVCSSHCEPTIEDSDDLILEQGTLIIDTDRAILLHYIGANETNLGNSTRNVTFFNNETTTSAFTTTNTATTQRVWNSGSGSTGYGPGTTPNVTQWDSIDTNLENSTNRQIVINNTVEVKPTYQPELTLSNTGSPSIVESTSNPINTNHGFNSSTIGPLTGNGTSYVTNTTADPMTKDPTSAQILTTTVDSPVLNRLVYGTLQNKTYVDNNNGLEWKYSVAVFSETKSISFAGNLTVIVTGMNPVLFQSDEDIFIGADINLDGGRLANRTMFAGGFQESLGPGRGADDPNIPSGAGHGGKGGGSYRQSQSQPCGRNIIKRPLEATTAQPTAKTIWRSVENVTNQTSTTQAPATADWNASSLTDKYNISNGTSSNETNVPTIATLVTSATSKNTTIDEPNSFPTDPSDFSSTDAFLQATVSTTVPLPTTSYDDGNLYNCSYGYAYLLTDYGHLLGGSAGGVGNVTFPRMGGGGAIELRAHNGIITIAAAITARGQSAPVGQTTPCLGGGSGGLIRLRGKTVHVESGASLVVSGGNSCDGNGRGGGGGGGIIQIRTGHGTSSVKYDSRSLILNGGKAFIHPGQNGKLFITAESGDGGNSNKCQSVDPCKCPHLFSPGTDCTRRTKAPEVTKRPTVTSTDTPSLNMHSAVPTSSTIGKSVTTSRLVATATPGTTQNFPDDITPEEATNYLKDYINKSMHFTDSTTPTKAANCMKEIEDVGMVTARALAKTRKYGETVSVRVVSDQFVIQLEVLEASIFSGYEFLASLYDTSEGSIVITIHQSVVPDEVEDDVIIVSTHFTQLHRYLPGFVDNGREWTEYLVNSAVQSVAVEMTRNTPNFTGGVQILSTDIKRSRGQQVVCAFWNFSSPRQPGGAWSTFGCSVDFNNDTHTLCTCDHLTNFAVLLRPKDFTLAPGHKRALEIITTVGLALSLACLLVALVVLAVLLRTLKNFEAAFIHLNLIIALAVANFFFLVGASATSSKVWCKTVAAILHYAYTVTFAWMLMEGIHLFIRIVRVLHPSSRAYLKYYVIAAWGLPIIIVAVTVSARPDGYGSDSACWLTTSKGTIWAFAGPVLVIIVVNIVFLIAVMLRFVSVKSIAKQSRLKQMRKTTRAAVILLPLLGITWLFGLLAVDESTLVFMYLFVVLNSLQGVFIFTFHCLKNDDVIAAFRIKVRKSRRRMNLHHPFSSEIKTTLQPSPRTRKKTNLVTPLAHTSIVDHPKTSGIADHWTEAQEHTF